MNLEELVTKDYLARQLAEERTATDKRFEQVNVKFAELQAYMDTRFEKIEARFTTLYWILSLVVAATVLPQLERLLSL